MTTGNIIDIVVELGVSGDVSAVLANGAPLPAWTVVQHDAVWVSTCKYCGAPITAQGADYLANGSDQADWRDDANEEPTCAPGYTRPHESDGDTTRIALPDDVTLIRATNKD